ncbi:MAG: 5-carboxymethyl-2-hydroxymuconate isomerase [Pseudomonadota bacterium]
MPHLSIEYGAGVEDKVDVPAFLAAMRDAIVAAPGDFPVGGTRVRAHRADHVVVADGGAHEFMHMIFRIGAGRDLATRQAAAEAVYTAAEAHLKPLIGDGSFALSFELVVMDSDTSIKRWNTIREYL